MPCRPIFRSAVALAAVLLTSAAAEAQLFRAYLAPYGVDSNPCTLPAPCRLLPAALTAVASGGEIWLLDSANYNTAEVAITKSVTILAVPGVVGSVVATGGNALNISAPGISVALRNLVMVPLAGTGALSGVHLTGAGAVLMIENCHISNMPTAAIRINGTPRMHVVDTTMRGNTFGVWISGGTATIARSTIVESTQYGVLVNGGGALTLQVDITASVLDGNATGVHASSNIDSSVVKVSVHGSQVARNGYGITAATSIGSTSFAASGNNISNNSNTGVYVNGTASRMWVAGNLVASNGIYGLRQEGGGILESAGNNHVRQNPFNTVGTIMKVAGE